MVFFKHATNFYFGLSFFLSLVGIAVTMVWRPFGVFVLLAAFLFTIWTIRVSDTKGFVRSGQMRRAYEPERHYNGLQTFVLMALLMAQTFVGVYATLFL